jgi:hypothetical protein
VCPHQAALDWIVVDEDERIGPMLSTWAIWRMLSTLGFQLARNAAKSSSLSCTAPSRLVFRTDRQQDAAIFEATQLALEVNEGFAIGAGSKLDTGEAVVADCAASQRAIKVQHDALLGLTLEGRYHAHGLEGE